MTDSHLPRRTLLRYGAYGTGAAALAATAASWDRLTGADIPGRDDGSLVVATLGAAFDPATVDALTKGFHRLHPDIPLRVNAVQAVDWSDFFAKILTQIAAGTAPTWCMWPPRACSCSPNGSACPWTAGCGGTRLSCVSTSPTSTPRWWSR